MFEKYDEQANIIEDLFFDFMEKQGYSILEYDCRRGGIAYKTDKFCVLFKLNATSYPRNFTIHVEDRNGYFALDGDTAAIYSLSECSDLSNEELTKKFKKLLNDVYEKYEIYNKSNRLDFVYNELEVERKEYNEMGLSLE